MPLKQTNRSLTNERNVNPLKLLCFKKHLQKTSQKTSKKSLKPLNPPAKSRLNMFQGTTWRRNGDVVKGKLA